MKDRPNNPRIEFSGLFNQQRQAAPLSIKVAFRETLELFLEDSFHPHLRNHSLRDTFTGYRSIYVTSDWRAIYKEIHSGKTITIYFSALGTHKQLYG